MNAAAPVEVIKICEEQGNCFSFNEETVGELLLHEEIKDRYVCVISVAGAFRKGKSFLMNFFLRFMYAKYVHHDVTDWLGNESKPLEGFSWRGGSERETAGILMWSHIFVHDYPNGDKLAILLLDTQGAYDSQSTVRDCATIFALSTMLSSIQIYNLSENIQESDLQHLQLFTEYGRIALEESNEPPFQRLFILVRDWSYPYDAAYGAVGGELLLKRRLAMNENQHAELKYVRRHIWSCFKKLNCYLMPHPGLQATVDPTFDGCLNRLSDEFKSCLEDMVPHLLDPSKLIFKEINGVRVCAAELLQYMKCYVNIYKSDELPVPRCIWLATVEANHLTALAEAKKLYGLRMDQICDGKYGYISSIRLETEHLSAKRHALNQFAAKRKMGGPEVTEKFQQELEEDIEQLFNNYKNSNESKNVFKAVRTPSVFITAIIFLNILTAILGMIGLDLVAGFAYMLSIVVILMLFIWTCVRYTGRYTQVGDTLDAVATVIWQQFMCPVYKFFMPHGSPLKSLANRPMSDVKPKQL